MLVKPPRISTIAFNATIVAQTGSLITSVVAQVKKRITEFVNSLGPGETLYMSRVTADVIENVPDLLAINFYADTNGLGTVSDTASPSTRTVLRTSSGNITIA